MKRFACYFFLIVYQVLICPCLSAQSALPDYERVISQRAEKIIASLKLTDSSAFFKLKNILAGQYRSLGKIHDTRNEQVAQLKAQHADQAVIENEVRKLATDADAKLKQLHNDFLSQLSSLLNPAQVDQVKDGMTYGVLPLTYKSYLDMLPRLNEEQKKQIMVYLIEAREYAMDAESSEKKHWWFGKYKGKINNYLSAAGYDLKKEGEEWKKRTKTRSANAAN